jgi:GT2 family glycosyltransferase
MKYIIGSGWWCSENKENDRDKLYGDDSIRSVDFHYHWLSSIEKNTSPDKICIIDSNSPIKPKISSDKIIYIELNENGGHSTKHVGKYSGWMRSVLHSMSYAQNSNCEYYIYVEQDVLLHGKGIIEYCIKNMKKPYMFGKCNLFHNPLQQSFFIIKKDSIDSFLSKIYSINYTDNQISPEKKFAISSSRFFNLLPKFIFVSPKNKLFKKMTWRVQNLICKAIGNYQYLPIGYGRDKPINFEDDYYYFQHATKDEIHEYLSKEI